MLSAVSFCLNLLLTIIFHECLRIPESFAYIPTIVFLTLFNFVACRKYVYTEATGTLLEQFQGFVMSIAMFRVLEYLVYYTFVSYLIVDYRVTIVVVAPCFAAAKYFWLKLNVFNSQPTADVG